MTSELQQAFVDDCLAVVQRKVALGSYPHAVYKKAAAAKAWVCTQWLVQTYPTTLSASDWNDLAWNKAISVSGDTVRLAHAHGLEKSASRSWKNSALAWEGLGVEFSLKFYTALWKTSGLKYQTRQQVFQLAKMHRFEPVEVWLSMEISTPEKEVQALTKQLWDHAVLHCDDVLLRWLNKSARRSVVMSHLYNSISAKSLPLPSILSRRKEGAEWSMDLFLNKGLDGLAMSIDEFCQCVSLYQAPRMRHVWSKMQGSACIPSDWRAFLSSGATIPVAGNDEQGLVMVLHGLFPQDEHSRMEHSVSAKDHQPEAQADLVDLL